MCKCIVNNCSKGFYRKVADCCVLNMQSIQKSDLLLKAVRLPCALRPQSKRA